MNNVPPQYLSLALDQAVRDVLFLQKRVKELEAQLEEINNKKAE